MTTKNNEAVTAETAETAIEWLRNTASLRAEMQSVGVALNSGASYVAEKLSKAALKASIEAATTAARSETAIKWGAERMAFVVTGKKGSVARFGLLSVCGKFAWLVGETGDKGLLSLEIFGGAHTDAAGKITAYGTAEFAALLAQAQSIDYVRKESGQKFSGKLVGSYADKLASCVYFFNGKLVNADIETRQNEYNAKVLGAIGGGGNEKMMARTVEALAMLAENKTTEKTVTKKKKTATKARKVEEASTEETAEIAIG